MTSGAAFASGNRAEAGGRARSGSRSKGWADAWAGSWAQSFIAAAERIWTDEPALRRAFLVKARRFAARLPFAEDLLSAYYCAFDRATPSHVKAALVGALAYFLLPADALPDVMPILGFTDDAAVLAAALRLVAAHVRPEHRDAARQAVSDALKP